MTVNVAAGSVAGSGPASSLNPNVVYASQYADLPTACAAARAVTGLGNGVGVVELDAKRYTLTAPLDVHNLYVKGKGYGSTAFVIATDWAAALPCNARFALDQQPSTALGAPTQNAPSQVSGSSAYTLNQVVSIWITASNSRNGGETPVSAMQQITVSAAGNQITANWTKHANIDVTTTYNVYMDRAGGTNSASAVKVASGQAGTSWQDSTGTGGSGAPPTVDTTGGVGINAPDFFRNGQNPTQGTCIEGVKIIGPGIDGIGVLPAHMSAIRQGGSTRIAGVSTAGVFAGISQNNDHEYIEWFNLGGYYPIYRAGPHGDDGDQVVRLGQLNGDWACFGIALEGGFGGAYFEKVHMGVTPFGFYSESIGIAGDAQIVGDCTFNDVSWESIGNGAFFCAGASQKAISQCTFNQAQSGKGLDPGVALANTATDYLGVAIGRHNATIDLNGFTFSSNWGSPPVSLNPGSGTCGIAALVTGGGDIDITGFINQLQSQGIPWANIGASSTNNDVAIVDTGRQVRIYKADSALSLGDLVQINGGAQSEVIKSDGTTKVLGVCALTTAINTQVLVFRTGKVTVNSGANAISGGQVVVPDAVNPGQVKAGTAASTNIVGVAMGFGASGGTVLVELQGLT